MKVALVYNLNRDEHVFEAEFDSQITIDALAKSLSTLHYEVILIESGENFENFIRQLKTTKADIIFNIAEGFAGPAREAVYPALYNQLGFKFTGPDATNLLVCHNKILTKKLLCFANILVPEGKIIVNGSMPIESFSTWTYPLIVKLNSEGSSLGLNEKSIVNNAISLKQQVKKVWREHHSSILIEEYIEGRDMSMVYIEGFGVMGPCEVICTDGSVIYDYDHKTSKDSLVNIRNPLNIPKTWSLKLKRITHKIAKVLDIQGYAKVDFRVAKNGNMYVLEVNGQVSFHPLGEFIVCVENEGYTMKDVIHHIVEYAYKKHM